MIVLLAIGYVLFLLAGRSHELGWRRAMLQAAVWCGAAVVALSELLSLSHSLEKGPLVASWVAISLAAAGYLMIRIRWHGAALFSSSFSNAFLPLERSEKVMLLAITALCLLTGVVAVTAPPNTWDAMEYHLPRVFFWMQNHSVENYPTPDYAQIVFSPFAEFAMLQTYILAGSDRFVNLVEFSSLLGSCVGVSLIAQSLGADRREQIFAALICATIPEGLLEASGAMNTFVVTFWIVTATYFLLLWREEQSWVVIAMLSGSVGIAILTKGSAYVYLPTVMLACWLAGTPSSQWALIKRIPVMAVVVILLNLGSFVRNISLTGSPLGLPFADGGPRFQWANENFSIVGGAANVIRNMTLHLATPFGFLNEFGDHAVRFVLRRIMGQDPDDPSHTWPGGWGLRWPPLTRHEIFAGNLMHALLVAVIMIVLVSRVRSKTWRTIQLYTLGPAGAFLLFSFLLRYQIWESRHHLPLFALMAAALALFISRWLGRQGVALVAAALVLWAVPFASGNLLRSLMPHAQASIFTRSRSELYFADQHFDQAFKNLALVPEVNRSSCRHIGIDAYVGQPDVSLLKSVPSFFVYPILAMLDRSVPGRTYLYVGVHNLTTRYILPSDFKPCSIICLDCAKATEKFSSYNGWKSVVIGNNVLFERQPEQDRSVLATESIVSKR